MIDLDLTSGRSLVIAVFVVAVLLFVLFLSSLGAILLGTVLVGGGLAVLYYTGVRIDRWARGGGMR